MRFIFIAYSALEKLLWFNLGGAVICGVACAGRARSSSIDQHFPKGRGAFGYDPAANQTTALREGIMLPTTSLGVRARGLLVLAILLAVTRGAGAAIPKEQLWHAVQSGTSYPVSLAPRFEDACNSIIDQWASFGYLGGSRIVVPSETVCRWLNVHRDGIDYGTLYFNMSKLPPACPANSGLVGDSCQCGLGYQEDPLQKSCLRASPERPWKVSGGNACPAGSAVGHPLLPATGEKYRDELDYTDSSPDALSFRRTYRSTWASDPSHASTGMGQIWTHNHGGVLKTAPSTIRLEKVDGCGREHHKARDLHPQPAQPHGLG